MNLLLRAHLERATPILLVEVSLIYWVFTTIRAMRRLWFDELHTYYMSRLPSLAVMWDALKDGADFNPPTLYVLTRAAHQVFGDGNIATRLPQMAGFLVMCICLYLFVSPRCGRLYGLLAMLFPMLTGAYIYASEARAYGIVLGCCGIALIAWQRCADRGQRRIWLPALTLGLAAALSTHCYAVFLLVPFGMGELARTWRSRKLDLSVWAAISLPALTVLLYLPLTTAIRSFTMGGSIFQADLNSIAKCYTSLFGPAAWMIVAALGAGILARNAGRAVAAGPRSPSDGPGLRFHETIVAGGLVLVPLVALAFAMATRGVFMDRYGLAAVIGVSILLTGMVFRGSDGNAVAAASLFVLFCAWFLGSSTVWLYRATHETADSSLPLLNLKMLPPDLPIVLSSGLMFLEAQHYERADVLARTYYLTDRPAALHYTSSDVFEQDFRRARRWFPLRGNLAELATFQTSHRKFLVFGPYAFPTDWLIRKLADDGAAMKLLGEYAGRYGDCLLLEVTSAGRVDVH